MPVPHPLILASDQSDSQMQFLCNVGSSCSSEELQHTGEHCVQIADGRDKHGLAMAARTYGHIASSVNALDRAELK